LKRILLPLAVILLGVGIFMALVASKAEKKTIERPEKVWRVSTVPVKFEQIAPEITVYGRVETPRTASINAAITADVTEVSVLEGATVEAGQVLLSLDGQDAALLLQQREADLAEIKALINQEQSRYRRDKALLVDEEKLLSLNNKAVYRAEALDKTRLVTRSSLDDAIANQQRQLVTVKRLKHDVAEHPARLAGLAARLKRVEALLSQAQLDVERAVIKAPFGGRIANLNVSIGDRVRVGDNLLSLYDLSSLEVRAQIPNRYLKQIRDNLATNKLSLAKAQLDDKTLSFELARLSGETRQDSGGVDGLFRLVNNQQPLTLGTFIELTLSLEKASQVVMVPFDALYSLDRVYRIEEGYLNAVKVNRIGEHQDQQGQVQLLIRSDALNEGDVLVSTQLPNAITGLRVEAMNE